MHPDFWHQRWQDNRIGFHQDAPTPLLQKHWPALGVPAAALLEEKSRPEARGI